VACHRLLNMDAAEQARIEEQRQQQELARQRYQAVLDAWVESQRAAAAAERRFRRELIPSTMATGTRQLPATTAVARRLQRG